MYYFDGECWVIGAGGVPYKVTIQIDQSIWDTVDADVQKMVNNILTNQPIPILSSGQASNGLKGESKGVEFHTQSDKRLGATGASVKSKTFRFDRFGKGWGH